MTRQCPTCGAMVGPGFSRCPNCGVALEGSAQTTTLSATTAVATPAGTAPTVVMGPAARSASGAHFFVKSGLDQGRLFPLEDLVTIGRSAGCGIRLTDPHVSAKHAQLKREGAAYIYLDLRSSSGSFLRIGDRQERLRDAHTLSNNDEVRLGETVLQFIRTPHGGKR
jgi:pSer/pThr/pTyr-binding forkhead associated (FHA) protein